MNVKCKQGFDPLRWTPGNCLPKSVWRRDRPVSTGGFREQRHTKNF